MKRALICAAALGAASSAWAATDSASTARQPREQATSQAMKMKESNLGDLKWGPAPPGLPPGAEAAVLSGNPDQAGDFEVMLRAPTNYKIASHWHSKTEHVLLLSGSATMAHGDEKTSLTSGGYSYLPARQVHALTCTSSESCLIEVHGMGPFDIHYVNPSDDPRTHRQARTAPGRAP